MIKKLEIKNMENKIHDFNIKIKELENQIEFKKKEKIWKKDDNSIFGILSRIKKLKTKDLKHLSDKLEVIRKNKFNEYYLAFNKNNDDPSISYSDTLLLFNDISDSLIYCLYHFSGNRYESKDNSEYCPCICLCQNCELIPENKIGIRMQEIGQEITEENTLESLNSFVKENFAEKKEATNNR